MFKLFLLFFALVALSNGHPRGWKKHKKRTKEINHKLEHLQEDVDNIMKLLSRIETCSCNLGETPITLPPPESTLVFVDNFSTTNGPAPGYYKELIWCLLILS